jgi:hypothetical protein
MATDSLGLQGLPADEPVAGLQAQLQCTVPAAENMEA